MSEQGTFWGGIQKTPYRSRTRIGTLSNGELKRRKAEHSKRWREQNRERLREHYAKYRDDPRVRERSKRHSREWYEKNRERALQQAAARYQADRPKYLKYAKEWAQKNPDKVHAYKDKKRQRQRQKWGIVDPPAETRTGPCEICGRVKRLCCDHDHDTGIKRGWLCHSCNLHYDWAIRFAPEIDKYFRKGAKNA